MVGLGPVLGSVLRLGLVLTLEVTNDNFHGVHRLELYIVAFLKNHCIANTGHKNINKIPLCC